MKIAITGGIGSGKSSVIESLKSFLPYYEYFSFDSAVAEMYEKDEKWKALLYDTLGTYDKVKISTMAFNNESLRQMLMRESKDTLFEKVNTWLKNPDCIIEFPLLFEADAEKLFDESILITAPIFVRAQRAAKRDGKTEDEMKIIIGKQMSDSEKIARASLVVSTEQSSSKVCAKQIILHLTRF